MANETAEITRKASLYLLSKYEWDFLLLFLNRQMIHSTGFCPSQTHPTLFIPIKEGWPTVTLYLIPTAGLIRL